LMLKCMLTVQFSPYVGLERFLIPYRDILVRKIEEGKRGRETAPEVIVEEVKERNADMDRSS
jgi:hypothetical protein